MRTTENTPLPSELLCKSCDPAQFAFETTADLDSEPVRILGQERAAAALQFGTGIRRPGYSLFALGPTGAGKHTAVLQHLNERACHETAPSDWCYVNNFANPHGPIALELPRGRGVELRADMERLMRDLQAAVPSAFQSDEYTKRRQEIEEEHKQRQDAAFEKLNEQAQNRGIALLRTPGGMVIAPVRNGEVLDPKEFNKLPEQERKDIEATSEEFQARLQTILGEFPKWESEQRENLRQLNREITRRAVSFLMDELRGRYTGLDGVLAFLDACRNDMLENAEHFLHRERQPFEAILGLSGQQEEEPAFFKRYQVNVVIDNSGSEHAPVVYEDRPSHHNLFGRIEHVPRLGALLTDFTLIKPGALHRANGGYLVLDARKVLTMPFAWEGLKRALTSGKIKIESIGEMLSLVSTVSLEPAAIPLDVKVVLVGEPLIYYLLSSLDPEFLELFKVPVDFDDRMDRSPESVQLFAHLIASITRGEGLRPLERGSVARTVERASRLAGDAEKLSTRMAELVDLLRESDYWAGEAGREVVMAEDVDRTVDAQITRSARLRDRVQDDIRRGNVMIDTFGSQVGQVNALSVIQLGDLAFGRPSRITARVRVGKGEVVDIEREVELGGPFHSKGVLILAGFLGARYARSSPLSLSASLVFEQSYSAVEGDSASCAELYALLSALAEVPIRQCFAVTGSVNQHGRVQPIGAVNEKIEGFFDTCRQAGLTGEQGVLIPRANIKHLMLRRDVVDAAAAGMFHVHAVESVDEGIEILTGMTAGERDPDGEFPQGTLNRLIDENLNHLAEVARAFAERQSKGAPS